MTQKLTNIKEDVETLNKHVRNENWSMVEILAEKLGYYYETTGIEILIKTKILITSSDIRWVCSRSA